MEGSESFNTTTKKTTMATIAEFSASLLKCRDILRKDGITGMDSMRTICLYILAKFFNIDRCKVLEVPEHLAWENIMITLRTKNGGVQHSLEYFKSKDDDSIIYHFDKLFNTQELPFNIKSPNVHKEILEIIDRIDFSKFDLHMDVIGYVFEQHLNTGASSSSRDLGQYFTDRSICNYIVELCKPGFKVPGVIESICDPTMGTAGFLTSAVKYYNKLNANIDWSVQQQQIHGCDLDAKVSGLANVNMFIESNGAKFENILEKDSLHNDLPQSGYDVILANMPFGIKGLKHAEVCERVKALKINGTKSEPLFLQLIMASLNKGGRCAVVVPDGVLINSSNLHNGTREYLLDNFELKKVIKMDGTFFMNTGIKPSILFFENTGSSTGPIEFCEVSKGSDGTVTEKSIVTVDRDQLDAAFTLDMRKFIVDDKPKTNTVYPMVKLEHLVTFKNGKNIPERERKEFGTYPYYASNGIKGYVEEYIFEGTYILLGDQGSAWDRSLHFVKDTKFYAGNHTITMCSSDTNKVLITYLYYCLKLTELSKYNKLASLIPELDKESFYNHEIPLPPLEVQQQIVETLDRIYESKEFSVKLSDNIKSQMSALVKSVAGRGFNEVKLEDVLEIVGGKGNYDRSDEYSIPYYDSNGIIGYVEQPLFTGEYTITARNMSIGSVHYINGPYYPSDHTINFTSKDINVVNNRYFYYWLFFNNHILKNLSSGIKPGIRKGDVVLINFPLPPLEFQQDLVRRLEALDSQLKSLDDLAKSSEDNAKYMLESYLTPAISNDSETVQENVEEVVEKPKRKIIRKVKSVE
jgi:restriction endonuclease S subunit